MDLIAQLALVLSLGVDPLWHEGRAVYYDKGLMEKVSRNRGMPIVGCMAAHPTVPIGTWIVISGRSSMLCRVTDTSQPEDRSRHIKLGLVELDYKSAHKVCPKGWTGKATECPIKWTRR